MPKRIKNKKVTTATLKMPGSELMIESTQRRRPSILVNRRIDRRTRSILSSSRFYTNASLTFKEVKSRSSPRPASELRTIKKSRMFQP